MRQGLQSAGHPVDVASGTVWGVYTDVDIPGRLRLTWQRRYSTALLESPVTPQGWGWATRYFATLTPDKSGYQLRAPEGETTLFPDPEHTVERGETIRLLGTFQELRRVGDRYIVTRWTIAGSKAERFVFYAGKPGQPCPLAAIEDDTGQGLDLIYDQSGRLARIQQRCERRALLIEYSPQNIVQSVSLQTPGEKPEVVVRYEYDSSYRLLRVTHAAGTTEAYEYDDNGRLTCEVMRGGGAFRFEYDDLGRCSRTYGDNGYDSRSFHYMEQVPWTEVTDSLGHVWRYEKNEFGQIVTAISPRGAVRKTGYDEFGRIVSITDALDRATTFAFDEFGNRTAMTTADGATYTSEYNDQHRIVRFADPLGAAWTFEYDQNNRITKITHPNEATWEHTWDKTGNLIAVNNPAGRRWQYQYDPQGQLHEVTNYDGARQRIAYDRFGYRSVFTDVHGGETHYRRDAAGRVIQVTYPDGSSIRTEYDAEGNITRVTDQNGHVRTYTYGPCCARLKSESNNGEEIRYEWSTEPGRLLAVVDALGQRHQYEYDEDGYLRRETFASGRTITYERDMTGAVVRRINSDGEAIEYTRDDVGRVVEAALPEGTRAAFAYDPAGRLIEAKNDDATVAFVRDIAGNRIKESCNGDSIENVYDRASFRRRRTSSVGHETSYDYDPVGNIVRMAFGEDSSLEFERDAGGRNTRRRFAGSVTLDQTFDPVGRLSAQSVRSGANADTELFSKQYEFDAAGRLNRVNDSRTGPTDSTYDPAGRLLERTLPNGTNERFSYDAAGNITSVTVAGTITPDSASAAKSTTSRREIGSGNRILRSGDTVFEYDSDDRLRRKTQDSSSPNPKTWAYRWNSLGLLAEVQTPTGDRWRYGYDALGRRISKQGPNVSKRYVWDGNAILHEIDASAETPSTWIFSPSDFTPLARQENGATHFIITDHLGTPQEMVDRDGRVAWSGTYRAWGGLTDAGPRDVDCPVRFPGQWYDEETGLHYNNLRYYDPELGSFISTDPIPLLSGPSGYRYALNPLNWIDPFGLDPEYYPLDGQGRPTGAYAEIGPGDTRPTGSSPPTVDPPGWQGGAHPHHQQRSHLIADTLGGSGSDARNLVTLTDGSNHPGMSTPEGRIRRHVQAGNTVLYEVRVNYDGDNTRPTSVHMYAIDQDGKVIVDETVENGRRQNTSCC